MVVMVVVVVVVLIVVSIMVEIYRFVISIIRYVGCSVHIDWQVTRGNTSRISSVVAVLVD